MRKFIVKLIVVTALLVLLAGLPVAVGHAHALIACQPLVHFPCTGGGIVCIDKHGRVFDRSHPHAHCVAI